MDTAHHAQAIMADGFPDRMASDGRTSLDVMVDAERYGQKNAKGYQYTLDRKGKLKKSADPEVADMIATVQANGRRVQYGRNPRAYDGANADRNHPMLGRRHCGYTK